MKVFGGGPHLLLLVLLGAWSPFIFTHHLSPAIFCWCALGLGLSLTVRWRCPTEPAMENGKLLPWGNIHSNYIYENRLPAFLLWPLSPLKTCEHSLCLKFSGKRYLGGWYTSAWGFFTSQWAASSEGFGISEMKFAQQLFTITLDQCAEVSQGFIPRLYSFPIHAEHPSPPTTALHDQVNWLELTNSSGSGPVSAHSYPKQEFRLKSTWLFLGICIICVILHRKVQGWTTPVWGKVTKTRKRLIRWNH